VTGVAQSSGARSGYPVISFEEMPSQLANFNLVISLLPYTAKTEKAFNSNFFASMNSSAIFINVGRGKTLDESALINALRAGQIRKAAIDVTYVEPLDSQSELWGLPGLIITPHISGGRPQEAERLIELNASRLLANQEVENFVAR
jgi:phosphoglycerate dehydrogenase-like enzyme